MKLMAVGMRTKGRYVICEWSEAEYFDGKYPEFQEGTYAMEDLLEMGQWSQEEILMLVQYGCTHANYIRLCVDYFFFEYSAACDAHQAKEAKKWA